ncbi:MAG: hypothetical protein RLZZ117_1776 [Cyanobacteriota bacterium]|jgi:predicted RNA-binding Zn ribbon-like protein
MGQIDPMTAARQALTVSVDPALVLAGPPQRLLDAWSAAAATATGGRMASRCGRRDRWSRDQQGPKPANSRQNGPMSADLLDQMRVLIG